MTARTRLVVVLAAGAVAASLPAALPAAAATKPAGTAALNLVFVLDGLRPDSINGSDTPNLARLRNQGVEFAASHSVTPTVTRVNASAIGSGYYPSGSGIVGNSMYVPAVDATKPFSTYDGENLLELGRKTGRIVLPPTLGERMQAAGKRLVTVGSGSSGSSLLLNPNAPQGAGVMINTGNISAVPLAYPAGVADAVQSRFGAPPNTDNAPDNSAKVDYATRVLTDYVLPDLKPDVAITWLTEPDSSQHEHGAGSPEAVATIRNDDAAIGRVLTTLNQLDLAKKTNIFIVSDHGFSLTGGTVDVAGELVAVGLKASPTSDDVVGAGTGASLVYVKDRDPQRIRAVADFLQRQDWAGPMYTAARRPVNGTYRALPGRTNLDRIRSGWVPGTQSLELVHEDNPERGADLLVTFQWNSAPNAFGVPGTATYSGSRTGPGSGQASNHGSFSPWDVHNTMLGWGVDVKDRVRSEVPASNVDVPATLLALEGIAVRDTLDGRPLREALEGGPDPAKVRARTSTVTSRTPLGHALTQVSFVDGHRYVDKSWLQP